MPRGRRLIVSESGRHFNVCECGFKTRSDTGMKLHVKQTHGGALVELTDETNEYGSRICPRCLEVFQNYSELKEHTGITRHIHT